MKKKFSVVTQDSLLIGVINTIGNTLAKKSLNLGAIDKIPSSVIVLLAVVVRQPIFFSSVLDKPPGKNFYISLEQYIFKKK